VHCNKNPINVHVFLLWELRGLSPNFHIHVSVSYLYITRIGPLISCRSIGRSGGNTQIAHRHKNVEFGLWPHSSFSGNICFEFSTLVLCNGGPVRRIQIVPTRPLLFLCTGGGCYVLYMTLLISKLF
jgi:hypothetical protein